LHLFVQEFSSINPKKDDKKGKITINMIKNYYIIKNMIKNYDIMKNMIKTIKKLNKKKNS